MLCAANSYDAVKLADRHIAEQLAGLAPVLYVDPPLSLLTARNHPELADSVKRPRLRIVKPGLARFTPVVQPFPSRRGMRPLTASVVRLWLHRAVSHLGGQVRAIISAWPLYPVFGSCGETVKMYWAQDDFVGGAVLLGLDGVALAANEQRIAAAADVIVAANPLVADTWRDRGYHPFLIPFGVDDGAYIAVDEAPAVHDVNLPGPIAGFVGHINERIDLRLLESIADRGRSLLLVGPRRPGFEPDRTNRLLARPNVSWVGSKPFEELPSYLKTIDVGLVPYGDSAFNRGSFPLKTLEYLAAGRPVVATDLPAIRWLATDLVDVATEPVPYADAVDRLLDQARTPDLVRRRQAFAADHSWKRRAAEIEAALSK